MPNYLEYRKRYYTSITKNIFVIQQTILDRNINKVRTRFSIKDNSLNSTSISDWYTLPLENGTFVDILQAIMPTVKNNLPLIETTYNRIDGLARMSQKVCSSFLLKDGTLIKQYLPISSSIIKFTTAFKNHDNVIPLTTGERVIYHHASDIIAIIVE